jgi:enamine deaminase RidA (YjgF/YER057c/UK114 family)
VRRALEPADYPFFDYRRFTFSLAIATELGIWLAGSTAVRYDAGTKRMTVSGGLVEQAAVIYDKMAVTLAAGGRGIGDITRLVQYVTPAAIGELPQLAELHATKFGGKSPLISTIIVRRLLREEALIEIEAIASVSDTAIPHHIPSVQGASRRDAWHLADAKLEKANYGRSDVLRTLELRSERIANNRIDPDNTGGAFTAILVPCLADRSAGVQIEMAASHEEQSGILYVAAAGDPKAGDIVGQTRQAYEQLDVQLRRAGLDFSHVVKTTEFITLDGLDAYRLTADIRRDIFTAPFPAATGVICQGLPQPGSQIVVEAIALRGHA